MRMAERSAVKHRGNRTLEWRPGDATFGRETSWGSKADELRTACKQLEKLFDETLIRGEVCSLNPAAVHGFTGHRQAVAALKMRPAFPAQQMVVEALCRQMDGTSTKNGPHLWTLRLPNVPLAQWATELLAGWVLPA
mmetsp:Transcript_20676/g.54680  ORF Transcript_20676/g.54680 Transcript_20676/m.54680 type:complete len:137 (-) Transcript_20676:21-431(-)